MKDREKGLRRLMNFAFEIRGKSNPRGSKPPSHTVCDLNHSTNRVDEFLHLRNGGNRTHAGGNPPSHTVCDLKHSANRVYTIGTECYHHM